MAPVKTKPFAKNIFSGQKYEVRGSKAIKYRPISDHSWWCQAAKWNINYVEYGVMWSQWKDKIEGM